MRKIFVSPTVAIAIDGLVGLVAAVFGLLSAIGVLYSNVVYIAVFGILFLVVLLIHDQLDVYIVGVLPDSISRDEWAKMSIVDLEEEE